MMIAMLTETQRKQIFSAIVEAQDRGQTVDESRSQIATRYGLEATQLRTIEQEGIQKSWPPL